MEDFKFTNEQVEEIANWTLSGLTMYYRDSQLSESEIQKYAVGQIFRSQTFVDVSNFAGKLTKNSRFIFATNKAAPLYQVNPDTEKWKLHTINANSYFKVLDIYKKGDKTQFFLLHIPANGVDFFRNTVLRLGGNNLEEQIIEKSRISLDQKMEMNAIPELEEQGWVQRTSFPIGLDVKGNFFSLQPTEEMMPQAVPLYNAIFKMTNDTELNIAKIVKQEKTKEKGGFWNKLLGRNKIFIGLTLTALILITMGLFSFFKKSSAPTQAQTHSSIDPYKDSSTNFIYNLLFCDNLNLYKEKTQQPYTYPFDILFSETSSIADLQKVIDDKNSDPRIKVLAYNKQLASGHKPNKKELLAVIVEVGLDEGLDVLASFNNGTARYINHTGKILIWETTNDTAANKITNELFTSSQNIVNQLGPWNKPRRPNPTRGNARITFLVSDGLYFGEGPIDVLFNDPMASSALTKATELMQYLTQKSLDTNK